MKGRQKRERERGRERGREATQEGREETYLLRTSWQTLLVIGKGKKCEVADSSHSFLFPRGRKRKRNSDTARKPVLINYIVINTTTRFSRSPPKQKEQAWFLVELLIPDITLLGFNGIPRNLLRFF